MKIGVREKDTDEIPVIDNQNEKITTKDREYPYDERKNMIKEKRETDTEKFIGQKLEWLRKKTLSLER